MSATFVKSLLETNQGLFFLIHDFNHMIGKYIDYSHVENNIGEELFKKIRKNERGVYLYSRLLLEEFNLKGEYSYNFSDMRTRIVLVSSEVLKKLHLYAGVAYASDLIAKTIMKEAVVKMREELGEELYNFAIRRAPLLIGDKPNLGIRRELGQSMYDYVLEAGKLCFESCLAGESKAILRRFILKFSKDIVWDFNVPVAIGDRVLAWKFLHRILIKEIGSEWSVCFS